MDLDIHTSRVRCYVMLLEELACKVQTGHHGKSERRYIHHPPTSLPLTWCLRFEQLGSILYANCTVYVRVLYALLLRLPSRVPRRPSVDTLLACYHLGHHNRSMGSKSALRAIEEICDTDTRCIKAAVVGAQGNAGPLGYYLRC